MGIVGVKIKIMPSSPKDNLEEIKNKVKTLVEQKGGKNREYLEEPIAFGLKAIIAFFEWPEEKELGELQEKIKKIKNVNSEQVIDMRRLVG